MEPGVGNGGDQPGAFQGDGLGTFPVALLCYASGHVCRYEQVGAGEGMDRVAPSIRGDGTRRCKTYGFCLV